MASVTTTVSLIGPDAAQVAVRFSASAANVSLVSDPESSDDPLDGHRRHLAVAKEARRHPPVYTVMSVDPLAVLVDAWAARLSGAADAHVETLIGLTPPEPGPDYYIVSPDLAEPHVHWYHGLLAGLSMTRIVPVSLDQAALRRALGELPTGRELPDLRTVAEAARGYIPTSALTVMS